MIYMSLMLTLTFDSVAARFFKTDGFDTNSDVISIGPTCMIVIM